MRYMKTNVLLLGLLTLFLISCQKEKAPVDYVLFSGKILNSKDKEVIVYTNNKSFEKKIPINPEGVFNDTLRIENKGYYRFNIGSESTAIHLKKGDELNVSINTTEFDESIVYTGNASEINNYLAKKYLLNEKLNGTREGKKALFLKEANEFKSKISEFEKEKNTLLASYTTLDPEFITEEKKYNHYDYLFSLNNYENYHKFFSKKNNYQVPEGFLDELKNIDIDNSKDFNNSISYQKLSSSIYKNLTSNRAKKDSIPYYKAYIEDLSQIKSPNIKDNFLNNIAHLLSPSNINLDDFYNLLTNASTNEDFKKRIKQKYDKIKVLAKGKPSPNFDFENYKGGKTSLADLKGKYVYIDVWATWCGPCKAEIPHLKNIEKRFHSKNIEFVSLSIDNKKNYPKWRKMVAEKELGGVQLIADKDWKSQFVVDYAINGIPRFILIDPEGKIVNADAPRPSNPELLNLFTELKI